MAKAKPPNNTPSENLAGLEGSLRPIASQIQAKTGARMTTKIGCRDWYQLGGNA